MAKKGLYKVYRTKEEYDIHVEDERHFARVWMLDHVTIALGRMGFREAKFREFDRVLDEVVQEYMTVYRDDRKDDKQMVYSVDTLDKALKQYVGSMFKPFKERYK